VTDWVTRPRIHHQFLPDVIQFEPGALSAADQTALAAKGHRLEPLQRPFGNMQAIFWDRAHARVEAASDPRGIGSAWVE
jgi:gamma-glutamyltranspeptidase/glutathione hydrolase